MSCYVMVFTYEHFIKFKKVSQCTPCLGSIGTRVGVHWDRTPKRFPYLCYHGYLVQRLGEGCIYCDHTWADRSWLVSDFDTCTWCKSSGIGIDTLWCESILMNNFEIKENVIPFNHMIATYSIVYLYLLLILNHTQYFGNNCIFSACPPGQ